MVIVALKNRPYLLNRGSQKVLISAVRDTERFKGINTGLANQSPLMANGQSELDAGAGVPQVSWGQSQGLAAVSSFPYP